MSADITAAEPQPATRTQEQILARYAEATADPDDILGWRREVLILPMTVETLRTLPGIENVPTTVEPLTYDQVEKEAREYLEFAVGKIVWHRGISASRSVQKLREFAWLLGRDDVVTAMDAAAYPQYGAPQVKAFAEGMGWPFLDALQDVEERTRLDRMAAGQPCEDDCAAGCGQ